VIPSGLDSTSAQAVDAVEGVGVGAGVGPDAVADVVHDAVVGDGEDYVEGMLAVHLINLPCSGYKLQNSD